MSMKDGSSFFRLLLNDLFQLWAMLLNFGEQSGWSLIQFTLTRATLSRFVRFNPLQFSSGVFKVFEANIRLLGSLLSAHLLMEDPNFPGLAPDWYLEDLLRSGTVGNVDATYC